MHPAPRSLLVCLAASALAMSGCVEQTSTSSGGGNFRSADGTGALSGATKTTASVQGSTFSASLQAGIFGLGSVPYDNFTLPLVDPLGRYIATEAGIAPVRDTALAAPGAPVPEATRVETYRLDPIENSVAQQAVVGEPVVLGRSCDQFGVLVEAQRHDGSRWIGKAAWETGEIEWLVQDGNVNAFASLGPQGQLAWSRRNAQGDFDLVVRHRDGRQWNLNSSGDSWLLPTWSGRDDGLFLTRLNDGVLDIVHAQATSGRNVSSVAHAHEPRFTRRDRLHGVPDDDRAAELVRRPHEGPSRAARLPTTRSRPAPWCGAPTASTGTASRRSASARTRR